MPASASNARSEKKRDKHAIPFIFLAAVFFILFDQFTKLIALHCLSLNQSTPVVKNFLYFTLVCNHGAAFGLFQNQTLLFVCTALVVVALVISDVRKSRQGGRLYHLAMGLLLAGALGNLIDRLFRGCVIDFIDFKVWPVFNVADSSITIGAILLGWHILNSERKGKKNAS